MELYDRNRKWWVALLATALVVVSFQQTHLQQTYAKEVVRFHVLANSDSDEDQELKLKVRNCVGAYVSGLLKGVTSKEETLRIMEDHLGDIEDVARQEIKKQGYTYEVSARIEMADFPVKVYGPYHMPAGAYNALQIRIGEGNGHNWWCVMYPNMCFVGSTYEIVEDEEKEQMYQVFTLYEYRKLIESPNKEIRFRYLKK